jgi:hypothetical protein
VDVFHHGAIKALVHGQSPYSVTFPDIYDPARSARFYGPGMSVNGVLNFGFPYPPVTLLMALPGELLFQDYRYSDLVALAASGALIAYARPGRLATVAAAILLFTPRMFFVLEQGWTEPFLIFLLSLIAFCACRGWMRPVPYLVGLLITAKQYMVFAAPAFLLLLDRPYELRKWGLFIAKAAGTAIAINLPFVLWDFQGYWRSVVTLQVLQPFRPDALCYMAWLYGEQKELPNEFVKWLGALASVAVSVWGFFRAPRTPAGMSAVAGASMLAFFALGKQAFCNHYFFAIGALAIAAGVIVQPERSRGR